MKIKREIYKALLKILPIPKIITKQKFKCREGYFFGYYDKSPWSSDDKYLLAHRYEIPLRMPRYGESIQLGFFIDEQFNRIGSTRAWNWQQGAMLQWLGSSRNIIYNDLHEENEVSIIVDTLGNELDRIPHHISAVDNNGNKALSYSFSRLRNCAIAYSYHGGGKNTNELCKPKSDGLSIIDINSKRSKTLFSLEELANLDSDHTMKDAFHYVNIASFSPSGRRIVFLHRWQKNGKEWTRMISSNLDRDNLFIFNTDGMVSHYAWRDDSHILAWARVPEKGIGFFLFCIESNKHEIVGIKYFSEDGHPSYSRDKRLILVDTYPNLFRLSRLNIFDSIEKSGYTIARIFSPYQYRGAVRCDLHPRWNHKNTEISFDSSFSGKRALCTLSILNKEKYINGK